MTRHGDGRPTQERGDPQRTVWSAVTTLERKAYTKREIVNALTDVAANLRRQDA